MNNDDSVIVLTDENGEFLRKGKNHPDNIIVINLSDEETSDNEANANLSATGSVLGSEQSSEQSSGSPKLFESPQVCKRSQLTVFEFYLTIFFLFIYRESHFR